MSVHVPLFSVKVLSDVNLNRILLIDIPSFLCSYNFNFQLFDVFKITFKSLKFGLLTKSGLS